METVDTELLREISQSHADFTKYGQLFSPIRVQDWTTCAAFSRSQLWTLQRTKPAPLRFFWRLILETEQPETQKAHC